MTRWARISKSAPMMNSVYRMSKRSYAIVGTGAVGGFYGARLQQAGCEVHFLLHSDYEHVAQHGLTIESKDGDFTLPRRERLPRSDRRTTLRYGHRRPQSNSQRSRETTVVPPHRPQPYRRGHAERPEQRTRLHRRRSGPGAGGVCFICSNKTGPGQIQHLDYGYVRSRRIPSDPNLGRHYGRHASG